MRRWTGILARPAVAAVNEILRTLRPRGRNRRQPRKDHLAVSIDALTIGCVLLSAQDDDDLVAFAHHVVVLARRRSGRSIPASAHRARRSRIASGDGRRARIERFKTGRRRVAASVSGSTGWYSCIDGRRSVAETAVGLQLLELLLQLRVATEASAEVLSADTSSVWASSRSERDTDCTCEQRIPILQTRWSERTIDPRFL